MWSKTPNFMLPPAVRRVLQVPGAAGGYPRRASPTPSPTRTPLWVSWSTSPASRGGTEWRRGNPLRLAIGGSVMGKIVRRVLDGHITLIEWSPSDAAMVEAAEVVFRREIENGYMAVDEESNQPVERLPVDAELVIMTIPMGGG